MTHGPKNVPNVGPRSRHGTNSNIRSSKYDRLLVSDHIYVGRFHLLWLKRFLLSSYHHLLIKYLSIVNSLWYNWLGLFPPYWIRHIHYVRFTFITLICEGILVLTSFFIMSHSTVYYFSRYNSYYLSKTDRPPSSSCTWLLTSTRYFFIIPVNYGTSHSSSYRCWLWFSRRKT